MGKRLNDDMRGAILTDVLVFGKNFVQTAEKYGINDTTVSLLVNSYGLIKDGQYEELKNIAISRTVGLDSLRWLFKHLGKTPPDGFFEDIERHRTNNRIVRAKQNAPVLHGNSETATTVVPQIPRPEEPLTGARTNIPPASAETGWQTRLKVSPDKVRMTVYFNGVPVVEGLARIKENKELALLQAISYAAHMCYKLTEQKKLGGAADQVGRR